MFGIRNDADRRLHLLLRMHGLPHSAATKGRGLLRVLLVRVGEVPADPESRRVLRDLGELMPANRCDGVRRSHDQSSPPPPPISHEPASLTPKSLPPMS
jgi:hypothetical protein